jgi:hypothetical protein
MLLVESTGEKGGCGKSIFAQVLASYFGMREWRWTGIDTDPVNKQFETLGEDRVTGINLQASGHWIDAEVEKFGNLVGEAMQSGEVDAILVDLGAAQLGLVDRIGQLDWPRHYAGLCLLNCGIQSISDDASEQHDQPGWPA